MKKLVLFVFLSVCFFTGIAQFIPPNNQLGTPNVITEGRGALTARQGIMVTVMDTLNNRATNYYGTTAVLPQDAGSPHPPLYMSNGLWWTAIGNGTNNIDTVYTERPIAVKFDSLGHQVIYLLINGLIDGGIVSFDSCNSLSVSAPTYNINYNQFNGLATSVHIDTSDATLNRIDRIVADTFNLVYVIKGTPASIALAPPFNPSSQISLAEISIPAGTACLNSAVRIVFDENLGEPDEFDLTTDGAIAADPDNADNPYHLTKAIFVSTYVDSSLLVFTDTGLQDTVTASSILKFYVYFNGLFNNQWQVQFWNNDTAVSNNLVINPFINVSDSNEYQNVSVPLNSFMFSGGSIFNKIIFTYRGWDTSGAKGFYLDYVQLQQGITPSAPSLKVDSTKIIAGNEYYYINGLAYLAGAVGGGGGGGGGVNIYNSDSTLAGDRIVDANGHTLTVADAGGVALNVGDPLTTDYAQMSVGNHDAYFSVQDGSLAANIEANTASGVNVAADNADYHYEMSLYPNAGEIHLDAGSNVSNDSRNITITDSLITFKQTIATVPQGDILMPVNSGGAKYIPLTVSVNGGTREVSDSAGNIDLTIAAGGGSVTSVGLTSTDITVGGTASPITTSGTFTLAIVRTADQSITSTAGQTAFVFSGVPSSYNAFWLDVNGTTVNQPLYYTKSSNTITLSSGLDNNDTVTLHFK